MLKHNLGSVCIGAFFIPPLQIGRSTLMHLNDKAMKRKYRYSVLRYVTGGFCGCLWWIQHVVQYASNYVYVSIAV